MGEYEDRYPEAYGRGEEAAQPTPPEQMQALRQGEPPRQVRDGPLFRSNPSAPTRPVTWRRPAGGESGPSEAAIVEPAVAPTAAGAGLLSYRGIGPRGYVRSSERIFEDVCDRLTENAFIDASDIEVTVEGSEVLLSGTVDSAIARSQAEAAAAAVVGVTYVQNDLRVRRA